MATLTKEDLTILKAPFRASEHEFLRGFVYITEFAIVTRIEEVDSAWEFEITALDSRAAVGTKNQVQVTCTAALTINGVTRYGVGQTIARETKPYTDKKTGEQLTDEANEAEKSAATDALKRAARLFGIGRYLLVLPKKVDTEGKLADWIQRMLDAKKSRDVDDGDQGDEIISEADMADAIARVRTHEQLDAIHQATSKSELDKIMGQEWEDGVFDREQQEYEDLITGDPVAIYNRETNDPVRDFPLPQNNEPEAEKPKERYTTPTNIVVTRVGKGDKLYYVIEGCTFFTREAFRLLGYDENIVGGLEAVGVTKLPDTITIVYVQDGDFKTPLRIRRNDTNAIVDVMTKLEPVLLLDA